MEDTFDHRAAARQHAKALRKAYAPVGLKAIMAHKRELVREGWCTFAEARVLKPSDIKVVEYRAVQTRRLR